MDKNLESLLIDIKLNLESLKKLASDNPFKSKINIKHKDIQEKYKITIKGESKTNYKKLDELDGIDCQDNFSDYFDSDFSFKDNISNGYMFFKHENNKLFTYTVYYSDRELSVDELSTLGEYTIGQWSDGIGEGFEQMPCYYDDGDKEVYISPWFYGQKFTINQEVYNKL